MQAYRQEKFPITIVRPSHTYDRTLPLPGGWTNLERLRRGKPVIVHGDGTSLWTLTHHTDFAKGFVGLLGNSARHRRGLPHHLRRVAELEPDLRAAGAAPPGWSRARARPLRPDHRLRSRVGRGLLGDKALSMVFDNSKIKRLVPDFICTIPFARGARRSSPGTTPTPPGSGWMSRLDALMDELIGKWG